MATLRDIELIYPGQWNGMPFGDYDIIEMVNNANYCLDETQPQLSLNHSQVAPDIIHHASFGAVMRFNLSYRSDGPVMVAQIDNVRDELADLLRYHYPRRSIEFWEQYQHRRTGRVLRNVIFGVSFLGSRMPPAVKSLASEFAVSYHDDAHQRGTRIIIPARRPFMKTPQKFAEVPVGSQTAAQDRPITPAEPERGLLPTTNELGLYLAARRAELGMTPAAVADAINATDSVIDSITEQTVLDLESGILLPSDMLLKDVAVALNVQRETLRGLMTRPSDWSAGDMQVFAERAVRNVLRRFAEDSESFGAYLRKAREQHNMSLEDLAMLLEVTTEELAAIEDAQVPDDSMLEKLAEALELELEDLKARRDAIEAVEEAVEGENQMAAEDSEDAEAEASRQFADMLAPVQREVERLKRERDKERKQRREEGIQHFLDTLSREYGASKLLTGPRIRTMLLRADDQRPVQFSEGANPETELDAMKHLLQDLARLGMDAVSVNTDRITNEHGVREFAEGDVGKIQEFQQEHRIASFRRAATLFLKQQREGK